MWFFTCLRRASREKKICQRFSGRVEVFLASILVAFIKMIFHVASSGWPWAVLQSWFTIDFIWGTRVCSMPQQRRLAEAEISIQSAWIEKCFTWRDSAHKPPASLWSSLIAFTRKASSYPHQAPRQLNFPFFQFRISVSSQLVSRERAGMKVLNSSTSFLSKQQNTNLSSRPEAFVDDCQLFFLPLAFLSKIYFYRRLLVFVCRIRWRNKKMFGRRKMKFDFA